MMGSAAGIAGADGGVVWPCVQAAEKAMQRRIETVLENRMIYLLLNETPVVQVAE
jgi:hypothetical protein